MTNNQAMTLGVNDGKEGHSNGEFTHRELVTSMGATEEPRQALLAACSLHPWWQTSIPATRGPKKNFWFVGDSGGDLISFAETQKGMQCQSGQCLMKEILLAGVSRKVLFTL